MTRAAMQAQVYFQDEWLVVRVAGRGQEGPVVACWECAGQLSAASHQPAWHQPPMPQNEFVRWTLLYIW